MRKNFLKTSIAALAVSVSLAACSPANLTRPSETSSAAVSNVSYEDVDTASPGSAEQIRQANSDATTVNDEEWSLDDAKEYDGGDITEAGVYRISGKNPDIKVAAPDDAQVVLVLSDANVGDITVESADDVAIFTEGSNTTGAIYAEADLTLSGSGSLDVTAEGDEADGIVSKDDLVVLSGTIKVTAGDDGLRGTDSLTIKGGELKVTASNGDALKSTKDDDETKGWVRVTGGSIDATAGDDIISAATDVLLEGGKVSGTAKNKGINAGDFIIGEGTQVSLEAEDDAFHSDGAIRLTSGDIQVAAGDDGVHAEVAAVLDGANLTVSTSEEALEAGLITIAGGDLNLSASDDGINGSGSTTAEAGEEAIAANEASESSTATGDNTTTDDAPADMPEPPSGSNGEMPEPPSGADAAAGQGGPGGGAPGAGGMEDSGEQVNITGGNVTIKAEGDGLDSNGDATVSGGTVKVWGPTNDGNGALDVNGDLNVTGGTLLAVGSAGMAITPTADNGLGFVAANVSGSSGDTVTIEDSAGVEVISFTAEKDFGNVVYSSSNLTNGDTYKVTVAGSGTDSDSSAEAVAGETSSGMMGGSGDMGNGDNPAGQAPEQQQGQAPRQMPPAQDPRRRNEASEDSTADGEDNADTQSS